MGVLRINENVVRENDGAAPLSRPIAAFHAAPGGWCAVASPLADRAVRLSTSHRGGAGGGGGNASLSFGISSELPALPRNFSHSTVLVVGKGLTAAMFAWGAVSQRAAASSATPPAPADPAARRRRFAAEDPALAALAYWTDNGAAYHVNSWRGDNESRACLDPATGAAAPRCLETLLPAVKADLDAAGVAVRQLQLDSWYYDGHPASGHVYCVRNWTKAKPQLFPSGTVERVVREMKVSSMLYLPFFCEDNVYREFRFIRGSSVDTCPRAAAVPQERAEQRPPGRREGTVHSAHGKVDFMRDHFLRYREFRLDQSAGLDAYARWLVDGVGAAAETTGVYLQLCMAQPYDLLLALHAPRVTQVRASQDYAACRGWDIGAASLLMWSLGIAPSKDVFWSTARQPGSPYQVGPPLVAPQRLRPRCVLR
jgi:hypothetical protein